MIDLRFTFGNVDPPLEPLEGIELDLADDDNRVAFGDFVFGVSELLGQFAVVGQEDQSGARCIESSDWKQALLVGYKVDHARSSLGIAIGAQDSFGFVQCVIDRTVLFEQLSVDTDRSGGQIDLHTDLGDGLSIDLNASLFDQFVDVAA